MQHRKEFIISLLCLFAFAGLTSTVQAEKSVFIISRHNTPSKAQVYSIESEGVTYQDEVDISTYNPGIGAVANAVWPEKELMFVTYESSDMIVWASTKTLKKVGEFDTNISNLAGIAVDESNELIYVVQRGYNELYIYSFDDANNTLLLENTYELELSATYIDPWWGLALDEGNGLLYLTDTSNRVHYYDTSDWSLEGYIDITVDSNDRRAIGIAVNPSLGYMYTGSFYGTGGYHQYLVRTSLSSPFDSIEVPVEGDYSNQEAIGLGVDEDTGNVFVTTDDDDFRVYDPNLTLLETEENDGIYSPAGVAVGGWYKTSFFSLVKDNNDPNNECVRPFIGMGIEDNYLDFDICWDTNGFADSNVLLIDYLPKECDYYSSTPTGDYNSVDHTVTWDLGNIFTNDSNCFFLRTKVNNWAQPGGSFTNLVIMEGDNYLNEATEDCNVCAWGSEIIYVDEDANGYNNGTSWDDAYNYLQDALTGARNCGAPVTAIWVAAGTYKPVESTEVEDYDDYSFELIEDVGLFGHFGGVGTYETSTSQRDFIDANNTTILEGQIGESASEGVYDVLTANNIEDAILDGFTVRGAYSGSGIYLNVSDVSIVNCKFKDNSSYGIEVYNYSYPDIHNSLFTDNSSQGINISYYCWPEISYCTFDGNDTTSDAIDIGNSVVVVENSVFEDHTDNGIEGSDGTLTLTNCDFSGNNDSAINISDVTTNVTNCSIKNCGDDGVYASDSDLTIDHTVISNSYDNALYTTGGCNLTFKNSVARYSGESALELYGNYTTTIKNNWIHDNGKDESTYYGGSGIWFNNQVSVPLVRNNTIYNNFTYGLQSSENGADPNVINCIIYGNDSNDLYRENGDFDTVNYCLLQNTHSGLGNLTGVPGFKNVTTNPNDLHLDGTSQCKDAGDPNGSYQWQTDIDGEDRVKYARVDIGADEYYWSAADYDESGNVNFDDFAYLDNSWQIADANISLDDDNDVDANDLALFCQDWLWEKSWDEGWMMCMGEGGGLLMDGMMAESSLAVESSTESISTENSDTLMFTDTRQSLAKMPERLKAKACRFYESSSLKTISAVRVKQVDIEEILDFLDKLWNSGELDESLSEQKYLEFRKAVENSSKF